MGGGCATGCCHFDSPCARANFDYSPPGNRRRGRRRWRQRQTHTINRFLAYYALLGHPPFPPLFHALPTRFTYVCVCIKSSIKAKLPSVLCVSCRYKHTYPCPALPTPPTVSHRIIRDMRIYGKYFNTRFVVVVVVALRIMCEIIMMMFIINTQDKRYVPSVSTNAIFQALFYMGQM